MAIFTAGKDSFNNLISKTPEQVLLTIQDRIETLKKNFRKNNETIIECGRIVEEMVTKEKNMHLENQELRAKINAIKEKTETNYENDEILSLMQIDILEIKIEAMDIVIQDKIEKLEIHENLTKNYIKGIQDDIEDIKNKIKNIEEERKHFYSFATAKNKDEEKKEVSKNSTKQNKCKDKDSKYIIKKKIKSKSISNNKDKKDKEDKKDTVVLYSSTEFDIFTLDDFAHVIKVDASEHECIIVLPKSGKYKNCKYKIIRLDKYNYNIISVMPANTFENINGNYTFKYIKPEHYAVLTDKGNGEWIFEEIKINQDNLYKMKS
jgi:hypothetical protein